MVETGDGVHFVHFRTMGAVTDTRRSSTSPRRLRSRLAAGGFALLTTGAGLSGFAPASAATPTRTVTLFDGTAIQVDNLSSGYKDPAVETLVKRADNSMGTQNASQTKVRGQMSTGDRV